MSRKYKFHDNDKHRLARLAQVCGLAHAWRTCAIEY